MANYYPVGPTGSRSSSTRAPQGIQTAGPRSSNIPGLNPSIEELGLRSRFGSVPDFYGRSELRGSVPRFARRGLKLGGVPLDVTRELVGRFYPWVNQYGEEWLEGQLREIANHLNVSPSGGSGVEPARGGGFKVPSGWVVTQDCGRPNEWMYNGTGACSDMTPGVWSEQGWGSAPGWEQSWSVALANRYTKWQAYHGQNQSFNYYQPAQTWEQVDPLAVAPPVWENVGKAVFAPFEDVLPHGDPGITPQHLPSMIPSFGGVIQGTYRPIPYASIPAFDALAQLGEEPWIMREVGPSSGVFGTPDAPLTPTSPGLGSGQPSAPPRFDLPTGLIDEGEWQNVEVIRHPDTGQHVDVIVGADGPVFVPPAYQYRPPGPGVREKKLSATPRWLVAGFGLATVAGATVRNLHRALPKKCKSKIRPGRTRRQDKRRRYDSMMKDIYRCIDQVNWDVFLVLMAETIPKFALSNYLQRQIDRPFGSAGFGGGTNLWHAMGPDPDFAPTNSSGMFAGRRDPLAIVNELQRDFNKWIGI